MHCPFCQAEDTKVIDSRLVADGSQTRRRRECEICHSRFTTFETADLALPRVVKNDGERQPFNGSKLKKGMLRALEKRPLSSEEIDTVFGKILNEIRTSGLREIPSLKIGEIMMNALKEVDTVAYVRFASVYRDFQDIQDFSEEISSLAKENIDLQIIEDDRFLCSKDEFKDFAKDKKSLLMESFYRKMRVKYNILMDGASRIYSNPQLEIFADDVKCAHGSTIGQLDNKAMFYMKSRGISEPVAKKLLLSAFVGDVVEAVKNDQIKKIITEEISTQCKT